MRVNKVEICGINTSKLKVLSAAEKRDLLEKSLMNMEQQKLLQSQWFCYGVSVLVVTTVM